MYRGGLRSKRIHNVNVRKRNKVQRKTTVDENANENDLVLLYCLNITNKSHITEMSNERGSIQYDAIQLYKYKVISSVHEKKNLQISGITEVG